ncbi:hypothetical protein GCM10009733_018010 [Nonomuraea maheshkhaliensis]|uniref:Uncharacterized protein n=1 Tax=Nonomuraea maheshkhaliensis TaxID=419590 RepID=A0ABN2F0X9_9ACTN
MIAWTRGACASWGRLSTRGSRWGAIAGGVIVLNEEVVRGFRISPEDIREVAGA